MGREARPGLRGRVSRLAWGGWQPGRCRTEEGVASVPMPPCGTALGHPPCLYEMHAPIARVGTGLFASRQFPFQDTGNIGNTRASLLVFSGHSGGDKGR